MLVAGACVVLGASFLEVTGFGFSLVCAPLLLLAGSGLTDVVAVANPVIGTMPRFVDDHTAASVNRSPPVHLPGLAVCRGLGGGLPIDRGGACCWRWTPGAPVGSAVALGSARDCRVPCFRNVTLGLVLVTGLITVGTSSTET